MPRPPSRLSEFDLIARYFAPLAAGEPGAFGLTDDAAVLEFAAGERVVVTTDAMVAGIHFPADDPPGLIARKLLRVNLSDLAAMGAQPRAYTLAAMLNATTGEDWLGEFAGGLAIDQVAFGITLIGGDTVSTPGPVAFSLTALGTVVGASALRRNGARPGDDVYVSGTVGDAFLGLAVVQSRLEVAATEDRAWLVDRFRLPEPRLPLGLRLVGMATAAADLSDGLVADLGHICEASGCAATIEVAAVPLSAAAARAVTNRQPLHHRLLAGGDDYELVFAAPVSERAGIDRMSREVGVRVTRIGCFIEPTGGGPTVDVRDADGNRIELGHGGYQHFQEEQGQSEN